MGVELFQPSNADHGEAFMQGFCYRCAKWPQSADAKRQCGIALRTMAYGIDDKEYPREWRYVEGEPTCTAFKDREEFNRERSAKRRQRLIASGSDDLFSAPVDTQEG